MIKLPELYPHQEDIRDRTRSALRQGPAILAANPGFGKTRCAKWILGSSANRTKKANQSGRSLFAVYRRGLVDNAIDSFAESPDIPHGTIMSGRETSYGSAIQVGSIDTLLAWFVQEDAYPSDVTFDLIIFDEAHSHHTKFSRFLNYHNARREELGLHPAYVVGLTATPQCKGLADLYKSIVNGPTTQWLIDEGYLSPFRYFRATSGDMSKLVKRGGEFTKGSEAEAMDGLAGDLVRDWKQYAEGRPTVGFFPRRSHAQDALLKLRAAGVRAEYVDGTTDDDKRKAIFDALNRHEIDYICNVQIVERGTDIPRIGCVQLCVAIGSVVRYRQMIGRGSRIHPEKTDCIVLDHGQNVERHGFFEDDIEWSLDRSEKDPGSEAERPTIECPQCKAIYRGGKCSNCEYEPTEKQRKSQGLEFDGSELQEIKPEHKKKPKGKSAEQLMIESIYRAGLSGKTWKQCVGIFYGANEKQGTNFRVPKRVTVGGNTYEMVRYGSHDGGKRVASIYPFVNRSHGGDYLVDGSKEQQDELGF